jgi:hypothetical protein
MNAISTRLPHIVTRSDMVTLLTTTYGVAQAVEDDEAHERLSKALTDRTLMNALLVSMAESLATYLGPNTDENALLDKFSKRVGTRKARVKEADGTQAAALIVHINSLLGLVPESTRMAMESEKGQATLRTSLRNVGAFLVQQLLK